MPKKIAIIILIVIALGGVAVMGYQTIRSAQSKQERMSTQAIDASIQAQDPLTTNLNPSIVGVKTSDWKSYRNEEYGFELLYPSTWRVLQRPGHVVQILAPADTSLWIRVIEERNEKMLDLDEWFRESTIVGGRPTVKAGAPLVVINDLQVYLLEERPRDTNLLFEAYFALEQNRILSMDGFASDEEGYLVVRSILDTLKAL